jgi:DNA-binding XRE family transcriptional regulator
MPKTSLIYDMTPEEYKAAREARGTQAEVAAELGVDRVTVANRERGAAKITREAALAIQALPVKRK